MRPELAFQLEASEVSKDLSFIQQWPPDKASLYIVDLVPGSPSDTQHEGMVSTRGGLVDMRRWA